MKNKYFIIFLIVIIGFSLLNLRYKFVAKWMSKVFRKNGQVSAIIPGIVNIGNINEGKIVIDSFAFHNTTRDTMYVKDIQSSCSCTVIETAKTKIPGGDSGTIKFQFNSYGKSGSVSEPISVYLRSNDSTRQFTVLIRGYVSPITN